MRPVLIVMVSLLLVGCGKHYWGKPGSSFTDFSQDTRECAQEHAMYMSGNKEYGIVSPDLYRACMKSRGWTRQQHQDPPPPGWFRGIEGDEIVRLDALPPQPHLEPVSDLPRCERGATAATARDSQGRWRCRL